MIKLKRFGYIKTLFVLFCVLPSYAFSLKTFQPVIAVGGGTSTTSDIGQSPSFPIQNPMTDEFYQYSANKASQTSGMLYGFLGVEWNVQPEWLIQTGIDYNQASPFKSSGTFEQGADLESADTYTYHYGVLLRQLLIEGKLLYLFKECYHPYLLAGVGASFNKVYNYYTSVPPFLTFTRMYADNSTTSFSYALGLGVDVDISSQTRFGLGYRFADLGQVKLGNANIDTTSVNGTFSQSHVYTNEVLAQFTFLI